MPQFFINRPVFAWVLAIAIVLAGLIALPQLPVARFPTVAPPSVSISASYPGATPRTMNDSVVALIERELSSVRNLLYFESSTDTSGTASITATFKPGTDPDMAQVDVQNRLKTIEPRLPQMVRQTGVTVESAASGFLMMISLASPDGRYDAVTLSDYLTRNVVEEIKRVPGVGKVQNFGAERAMRIWVQPEKADRLWPVHVGCDRRHCRAEHPDRAGRAGRGTGGAGPAGAGALTVDGQLKNPDEFARIVLKANTDGSSVTLGDVARVELGAQSYAMSTRENGRGVGAIGVQLAPGANAVATANAVEARMKDLARAMPPGMEWHVPFTTAPFVTVSIEKVVHTLIEAMVLVFLVMYLFLQNIRYTLIPAIVAPIALLGTLGVMWVTGFSINVLTMFGMVLAIGIIVDDAIVVVENVERLMVEEGLPPREATQKAMKEITGAVIGITLVLVAVFLPMALANGSVGAIYRQFTLSMAVSILFSAFLALSLTPALCATLLKPVSGHAAKNRFFAAFDRGFERMTGGYERWVGALLKRGGRAMLVLAAMVGLLGVAYANLPSAFLPEEDQGYFITSFQLPADATAARTSEAMKVLERHVAQRPGIETNEAVMGFGFSGSGPNAAMAFTVLRDWNQRHGTTITDEIARATQALPP
jgi:multidrug efflux pump